MPACIFAGSIVRRKRPHLLVEAMGILRAKGHDCQLVLAGPEHEPDYAREMRARAAALAIEDKIAWLGFTREMAQIYPLCDMLCLPSVNEGLPGVLLEAMACGLPCIGTDVSGFRDVIDDGVNGRIVSGGAESIADAMADYFADPRLCREHGDKARRKMVADFSVERILEKYLAVFSRVVTVGEARH